MWLWNHLVCCWYMSTLFWNSALVKHEWCVHHAAGGTSAQTTRCEKRIFSLSFVTLPRHGTWSHLSVWLCGHPARAYDSEVAHLRLIQAIRDHIAALAVTCRFLWPTRTRHLACPKTGTEETIDFSPAVHYTSPQIFDSTEDHFSHSHQMTTSQDTSTYGPSELQDHLASNEHGDILCQGTSCCTAATASTTPTIPSVVPQQPTTTGQAFPDPQSARHMLPSNTPPTHQTLDHRAFIGLPGQAPMPAEEHLTIDQPIPVLPTPNIRVLRRGWPWCQTFRTGFPVSGGSLHTRHTFLSPDSSAQKLGLWQFHPPVNSGGALVPPYFIDINRGDTGPPCKATSIEWRCTGFFWHHFLYRIVGHECTLGNCFF